MLRRPADAERAARHPCEFNVLIPMNYKSRAAALDSRYWERKVRSPAIHVITPTILSPRTLPRCASGLPCDTENCMGITGNVFERPSSQIRRTSTLFNNSKNLAPSSQEFRPGITGTTKGPESGNYSLSGMMYFGNG